MVTTLFIEATAGDYIGHAGHRSYGGHAYQLYHAHTLATDVSCSLVVVTLVMSAKWSPLTGVTTVVSMTIFFIRVQRAHHSSSWVLLNFRMWPSVLTLDSEGTPPWQVGTRSQHDPVDTVATAWL